MIAIVGAGLTGLALAHELSRRGADFLVLEADRRPGGVIRSLRHDGLLLELGPQRARKTGAFAGLTREFGLDGAVITAPPGLPLFVYHAERLRRVPFGLRALLATDLLSPPARLRLLAEPFTGALRDDESAGAYLRRKFGEESYRNLLGPLYGGLYASDPDEMPARHALKATLRELGVRRSILLRLLTRGASTAGGAALPPVTLEDGLQSLADALHRAHAARVEAGTTVRRLARRGDHWVLLVRGSARTIACEHVVLTTPAAAAAGLLEEVAPDAAGRLARLRYNPLALVHMRAPGLPAGLGYQVAFGEDTQTRGVTFNGGMFPGRRDRDALCTAFLGGARHPEAVNMPDDWIAETACNELTRATGCAATPLHVSRTRVPSWDSTWRALEGISLPAGVHLAAGYVARPGIPGRLAQATRLADALTGGGRL